MQRPVNDSDRQKRTRWMVFGLVLLALSFYVGFIVMTALNGQGG